MRHTISNSDNVIDSRDVIARIEELEAERTDLLDAVESAEDDDKHDKHEMEVLAWNDENADELKALQSLAEEGSGSSDWIHGETLIADSYFEEYAQELAEDIGAINRDATWPNDCIDWEKAAEALQQDYSSVDYDGETYWIRS